MRLTELNDKAPTILLADISKPSTLLGYQPTQRIGEGIKVAMEKEKRDSINQIYNVAVGDRTTLNELYEQLHLNLLPNYPHLQGAQPVYRDFRAGDVRHSLSDISKASKSLGYQPTHRIGEGLKVAMEWYIRHVAQQQGTAHRLDKNIMSGRTDAIRR